MEISLSSDACGVIATVIPIYLIVLVAGRDRLLNGSRGTPRRAGVDGIAMAMAVFLSLAEVVTLWGLVNDQGLQLIGTAIVATTLLYAVTMTGIGFAIDINRDAANRDAIDRLSPPGDE